MNSISTTCHGLEHRLFREARKRSSLFLLLFTCGTVAGAAAEATLSKPASDDFTELNIDDLASMKITSVSKKEEKLSEAAAAIHVVTQEEIRRSGATSLAQALRNVPGLEVAQVDSRQWAITSRGFNSTTANKLLVLIDGRSVYTPLFSGVFWDVQNTMLEDVERIEVIRGPGGTVWGANAVNGVINVITKSAKDKSSQGLLLYGGGGTFERGFGGARYGGQLSTNAFYRVYGTYFDRDSTHRPNGVDAKDAWDMGQGGFRIDWDVSQNNLITFQGDIYDGSIQQPTASDISVTGGNLLGRYTHTFSEDSDLTVQLYFDRTRREIPASITDDLNTYDVDAQHRFPLGKRQEIIWGLEYRLYDNEVRNTPALAFLPAEVTKQLFSGFVQDQITLVEDRLRLTVGTKLEHNDFSGFEVQPSGRVSWILNNQQTVWGAVSRAVRTPSRIDQDLFVPGAPPFTVFAGNRDFVSEDLLAYELGYRITPIDRLSVSVAAFYNVYDDLRSIAPGRPAILANGLEGETYGAEINGSFEAAKWWRLHAGYSYLQMQLHTKSSSTDVTSEGQEGDSPHHQFYLRSSMDLPGKLELDAGLRYVDNLPHQLIDPYTSLDVRLAWRPNKNLEFSVVGQHLLDKRHPEFGLPASRKEIERGVYGKVTCRF